MLLAHGAVSYVGTVMIGKLVLKNLKFTTHTLEYYSTICCRRKDRITVDKQNVRMNKIRN